MTGPDHYLEAERLARLVALDQEMEQGSRLIHLRAAQVHATLALAAATALQSPGGQDGGMYFADAKAWETVCSKAAADG